MSKDPAFLFYSNDFLAGTYTMSDAQVGQYIRLLCLQHQAGHLTEKHMSNICKSYDEDIMCKFKKDEYGLFYNARLEEETNRRKAYSESRRCNRKSKKENICQTHDDTYVEHMETETETETETVNKTKDTKTRKRKDPVFSHDSKPYQCAEYLDNQIVERTPERKPSSEDRLQKWALEFDLTNRKDEKSWELIEKVLVFSQEDEFWRGNILSGEKFRKKFEMLQAKIKG